MTQKMIRSVLLAGIAAASLIICGNGSSWASVKSNSTDRAANSPSSKIAIAVSAQDEMRQEAENFVRSVSSRGIGFLQNKSLTYDQQRREFDALLRDSFDLRTIGRFALGRYWRNASKAQRSEYLKLFKNMVIESYAQRFGEYGGQTLTVERSRMDNERDTIVFSRLSGSQPVSIDWRVRHKNGEYRVVDIMVEGVSMSLTQRSEFSAIIQRGGGDVQVLIDKLKEY